MSIKWTLILMVIVGVLSAGVTRYYFPKVEFQNTETTKEVVRNDVRTIVKEVTHPDGTKETVTETTDKSIKKETSKNDTVIAAKPQWLVSVGTRAQLSNLNLLTYEVEAQRRILGPLYLGAKVSSDKSVGVSVGMEF